MGTQLPLPYRGTVPQFSAIVRCGQTTRWTNMALGMEVGLGPGDFVRWGPSYTQHIGHTHYHTVFGPCLLWQNGWMDEDATWYGSRPRPRPQCIRRGPRYPRKGNNSPPLFGPCPLGPRSPISATVELFFTLFFRFIIYVATKNLHWGDSQQHVERLSVLGWWRNENSDSSSKFVTLVCHNTLLSNATLLSVPQHIN